MNCRPALAALALFAAGCPKPDAVCPSDKMVVATWGDQKITLGELDKEIAKDLYQVRRQAIEEKVIRKLLADEAKARGMTEEELAAKVQADVKEPSEEQLRALFETYRPMLGDKSYEEVMPMLLPRLREQAVKAAISSFVDDLKKKANVKVTLPEPRVAVEPIGPSKGAPDAKVTIVEFSDFQCPYCAHVQETLASVMKRFEGKVRVVFRDFPLSFHPDAQKAAEAGQCAAAQGKFWQMHDAMFADQKALGVDDLKATAKKLGLDTKAFDACLDGGTMAAKVKANIEAGEKVGVEGTPTFFVNGLQLNGIDEEDFVKAIERELERV